MAILLVIKGIGFESIFRQVVELAEGSDRAWPAAAS